MKLKISIKIIFFLVSHLTLVGQSLQLPSFYSDHMVLQRDTTIIVGDCQPNTEVIIFLGKSTVKTTSNTNGKWKATLYGLKAGGPFQLKITTKNESKLFKNVLIGDVWVASGQSNMEWSPKKGVDDWDEEKKNATYENIRLFHVEKATTGTPLTNLENHQWEKCNPESLNRFSAVAYFFSKYVHENQNIPIGIIHSSFGGSRIESWMSEKALKASKVAHEPIWSQEKFRQTKKKSSRDNALRTEIFEKINVGERWGAHKSNFDDTDWETMSSPQNWSDTELKDAGFVWFRKKVKVDAEKIKGDSCKLSLGRIRHRGIVYLNGNKVGELWDAPNKFLKVATKQLVNGENTIAIRIVKFWGTSAGFMGEPQDLFLADLENPTSKISLAGDWKYNRNIEPTFPNPVIFHHVPTALFNGMIAALTPLKIKGFLWYQGESNAMRNAADYDELLKAMITDWRERFQTPNAPFIVVQLPNYYEYKEQPSDHNWSRIRESIENTTALSNVDMAVIIDLGNPKDVHPRNKKDVGYRLSLVARKKVYGEKLVHTGPSLKSVKLKGDKATLVFNNVGKGLKSKDGETLREFAVAGTDEQFYWGKAKIINKKTIEVSSDKVKKVVAVRYAWQSNPKVNLYNQEGLPAAPFRTDEWAQKEELE